MIRVQLFEKNVHKNSANTADREVVTRVIHYDINQPECLISKLKILIFHAS